MSQTEKAAETQIAPVAAGPVPVKFSATKAKISKMAKKWKTVPDMTTKEGYADAQQAKRELTPMRTAIMKEMDAQKETAQTHIKNINAKGNELVELVKAIESPIYDAKKVQDEAVAKKKREDEEKEERRTLAIEAAVEEIQELTEGLLGADLKTLEERLKEAEAITITDAVYMEFVEQASNVLDQTKTQLKNAVETAKSQAEQQKTLDAQQEDIKKTERKAKLQESIGRIRMAPVDLIGGTVADMQVAVDKLAGIDVVNDYGDLSEDAQTAIDDTRTKLQNMITQQQGLDDQQKEIDRQNDERIQRERDEQQVKDDAAAEEQQAKDKETEAAALAERMPDDVKLREYAKSLEAVVVPFIDDTYMLTIQSRAVTMVEDIAKFITANTQDPA